MRHWCNSALVLAMTLAVPCGASAQTGGVTVRMVLPFGGGGSGDALTRIVAEQLSSSLGQPVIVELRPGASGRIGVRAVKDAAPDGNTLLMSPIAPMTVYQQVYPQLDYDPVADFEPVSQVATFDFGLAVSDHVPAKSMRDLIDWLKARPAEANYGSPGAGTLPHFFGVMLGRVANLDIRHIQYKGSTAAMTDLLGGRLAFVLTSSNELVELHKAGRVRVLATSNVIRSRYFPDVPTFLEAGFDIEGVGWFGLFAPAKTPAKVVGRLGGLTMQALQKDAVRERVTAIGLTPTGTDPQELARIQRADIERWAPAVKASGFRPTQ